MFHWLLSWLLRPCWGPEDHGLRFYARVHLLTLKLKRRLLFRSACEVGTSIKLHGAARVTGEGEQPGKPGNAAAAPDSASDSRSNCATRFCQHLRGAPHGCHARHTPTAKDECMFQRCCRRGRGVSEVRSLLLKRNRPVFVFPQ